MSELIRKLAQQIRSAEEQRTAAIAEKCAHIVSATTGLALLRKKLGGSNVV